jgi:hypothetical protein
MRPELPTASVGSSQAPTAAVDNSAPVPIARCLFISWGKTVQTSGATSVVADDSASLFTTNRNQIASTDAEFKNIYLLIFSPTQEAINHLKFIGYFL